MRTSIMSSTSYIIFDSCVRFIFRLEAQVKDPNFFPARVLCLSSVLSQIFFAFVGAHCLQSKQQ